MDTTVKWICPACKHDDMQGAGATIGGRVMSWKKKCPACNLVLLVVPMKDNLQYELKATTIEERKDLAIKKAREESELELAKTITRIKERDY